MAAAAVKLGSRPPWVGLGAAVWVQVAAGSAFAFPLYSPSLKSVLGFNQQQLTILGVANDIGENVGTLPGMASNRFPPWAVLLVGAVCGFLGFGVLYLAVSETVTSVPYWLVSVHPAALSVHGGPALLVLGEDGSFRVFSLRNSPPRSPNLGKRVGDLIAQVSCDDASSFPLFFFAELFGWTRELPV